MSADVFSFLHCVLEHQVYILKSGIAESYWSWIPKFLRNIYIVLLKRQISQDCQLKWMRFLGYLNPYSNQLLLFFICANFSETWVIFFFWFAFHWLLETTMFMHVHSAIYISSVRMFMFINSSIFSILNLQLSTMVTSMIVIRFHHKQNILIHQCKWGWCKAS